MAQRWFNFIRYRNWVRRHYGWSRMTATRMWGEMLNTPEVDKRWVEELQDREATHMKYT